MDGLHEEIWKFVDLQSRLLSVAVGSSALGPSALTPRRTGEVELDGAKWSYRTHGAGYRFEEVTGRRVVEAHDLRFGFEAFDVFRLLIYLRHQKVRNKELRHEIARLSNDQLDEALRRETRKLSDDGLAIPCDDANWRLVRTLEMLRVRLDGFEQVVHGVRLADDTFSFDWDGQFPSRDKGTTLGCTLEGDGARVLERTEGKYEIESVTLALNDGKTLPRPQLDERVARVVYGHPDAYDGFAIINRVEERDDYWFVPVAQIGAFGFVLPKTTQKPVDLGSGLGNREVGLWSYEQGLLDSHEFAIEITEVYRRETASELLQRILTACRFRIFRHILRGLDDLPLRVDGLDWRAIALLHEDARRTFDWRSV